ncbi:hypothetical protein L1887_11570 [Cichorium endivia]|nr:hypothetical protein L1887_11570 [Cichorium endivia]
MVAIKKIEVDLLQLRVAVAAYSWSIMLISTLYVLRPELDDDLLSKEMEFEEAEEELRNRQNNGEKRARALLDWKWDDVDDPTDVGLRCDDQALVVPVSDH